MQYITAIAITLLASSTPVLAQSNLLESVKRNPEEARALCEQFKKLNSRGISASSKESITEISRQRNLNNTDAEILSIYVIGLHCPDVN